MKRIAYGALALICAGISALLAAEWFHSGPLAAPESVAAYHFGSESMRAAGGWKYANAQIYSTFAWIESAAFFGIALLFAFSVFKKKDRFAVIAAVIWASIFGANILLR